MARTRPCTSSALSGRTNRNAASATSTFMTGTVRPPCDGRTRADLARADYAAVRMSLRVGNRAERCGRDQLHVLRQQALGVARLGRFPLLAARSELLRRHVELDQPLLGVDRDRVALLYERDGAADIGLWSYVADHHPPGAAREAPVGQETHRLAQALAD